MEIITGIIIIKDNKVLMVKESKKECYGKLAFPAGHVEDGENIMEAAKRELLEETGYKAGLTKVFPIISFSGNRPMIMIHFLGNNEKLIQKYNTDEILGIEWIDLNDLHNLDSSQFRNYDVFETIINSLLHNQIYELDLLKSLES